MTQSRVDERTGGNGEGQLLDTLEQAPAAAAADCLSYNPGNLSIITLIRQGLTSYTVRDGNHWITNYPSFTDAFNARRYMANFNTICFTGRGTPTINYWFEKR